MKEFNALKKLAESAGSEAGQRKVWKLFNALEDKMEDAYDGISAVREQLQSSVLADMLKQEGFPATESKACKDAVEAAYKAVKLASSELEDLHQALGTHFETPDA